MTASTRKTKTTGADIRKGYDASKRDFDRMFILMPLFRSLSFPATALFSRLGISASQATWLSLLLGLIGVVMMAHGDYAWVLAGVIFVNLWSITDYIDGNLARYHQQSSVYGKFLDDFGGELVEVGFFFAAGIGLYRRPVWSLGLQFDPGVYLVVGALAALMLLGGRAMHLKFRELFGARVRNAGGPAGMPGHGGGARGLLLFMQRNVTSVSGLVLPLLVLAAVLDGMDVFLLAYGLIYSAQFAASGVILVRKGRANPQGFGGERR